MVPGGRRKLCKAVNLSATGVFIETTNLGLRKGQQVTLAFAINLGAITKLHRRMAVVAHVSRGGTGLMMESYSARSAEPPNKLHFRPPAFELMLAPHYVRLGLPEPAQSPSKNDFTA